MSVEVGSYGDAGGGETHTVTLTNGAMKAVFTDYGARLLELWVPNRRGDLADVVLGVGDIAALQSDNSYFGATCGRFANRIKGGQFTLDQQRYHLDLNEGPNQLHGGSVGFDKHIWSFEVDETNTAVRFSTTSPDGDQGFPGDAAVSAEYSLGADSLDIAMAGETTAPTFLNMVHHTYWNLAGHESGHVLDQQVQIAADFYIPVDDALIPTGEVRAVAGTPYDFGELHRIGDAIGDVDRGAGSDSPGGYAGYDHSWVLRGELGTMRHAATAVDVASGRRLDLSTNKPAVHFYTAAHLSDADVGKGNVRYCPFAGYAFETEYFPDSPNHPHFPSARLDPGEIYDHRMKITFSIS